MPYLRDFEREIPDMARLVQPAEVYPTGFRTSALLNLRKIISRQYKGMGIVEEYKQKGFNHHIKHHVICLQEARCTELILLIQSVVKTVTLHAGYHWK